MSDCKVFRQMLVLPVALAGLSLMIGSAVGQAPDVSTLSQLAPSDEILLAQQAVAPAAEPAAADPAATEPAAVVPAEPSPIADILDEPQPTRRPAARTTPRPRSRFVTASRSPSRIPLDRLASLPNMFGDDPRGPNLQLAQADYYYPPYDGDPWSYDAVVDIPAPGGGQRVKIGENNKALPTDRIYFSYNHFDNALVTGGYNVPQRTFSVDRYTLGAEKTFCDGQWSAELRMPLGGGYHLSTPNFGTVGGDVGNLALILKRLLYTSDNCAVAGGLGIDTPTGEDVTGQTQGTDFTFYNDAVHLSPWVGFLHASDDSCFFYQGFLQVDVATNGNRVDFDANRIGTISDQTLMLIDLETGCWLYRNPCAELITGLASVLEFHYTTTMVDADRIGGIDGGGQYLAVTNIENRMDIANLTVGLHAEMGLTTLSIGGVFPLSTNSNRTFDSEVQLFLNRRF